MKIVSVINFVCFLHCDTPVNGENVVVYEVMLFLTSKEARVMQKQPPPKVFLGKGVLKNAANLQENTHAEMLFQ